MCYCEPLGLEVFTSCVSVMTNKALFLIQTKTVEFIEDILNWISPQMLTAKSFLQFIADIASDSYCDSHWNILFPVSPRFLFCEDSSPAEIPDQGPENEHIPR